MGEWMSGIIHIDDLKDQIGDNIEMLQKLKDTDNSIAKVNSGLGKLFSNISEKDILFKDGSTKILDGLFEELNETGFMKARKLGLVYKPYKVRFKKNKKKVNIMKAELATKTIAPSISRELRTERNEQINTTPLRITSAEKEGTESAYFKRSVEETAHLLFARVNRLAQSILGRGIEEPSYVFIEKSSDGTAAECVTEKGKKPVVIFHVDNISTFFMPGKDKEKVNQLIGHELSHALLDRALSADNASPVLANPSSRKLLNEGLADLLGYHVALLESGKKATPMETVIALLADTSLDAARDASAIKIYRDSLTKLYPTSANLSGFIQAMEALDMANFRHDMFYTAPKLALARALIESDSKSVAEFVVNVIKNPERYSSISDLLTNNDPTVKALGRFSADLANLNSDFSVIQSTVHEKVGQIEQAKQVQMESRPTLMESFTSIFSVKKPKEPVVELIDFHKLYDEAKRQLGFKKTIAAADRMISVSTATTLEADKLIDEARARM
jgi:hypothetical protein